MSAAATRPNIVYILADDWGYGDVSALNPQSKIQTPCTDAFAREGMTFTDAHSNSAVCTPTRYGVLTGRYCYRSRLKQGVLYGYSDPLIEPGRMTVAHLLKQAGYSTACIGKWHLGLGWQRKSDGLEDVDWSKPLTHGPHTLGFDESWIIPASLDMAPYCYIESGRVVEAATACCEDSPRPAFWRGGPISPGFQHETCLLELTRRCEAWIAMQAARQQPFFLYFATPSPHTPHVPRPPFVGKSRAGPYGDFVVEHDWSVGQVLAALDRNGLRDNTLVIITSDNGAHMRGDGFDFEQTWGHRSNHIFRGQKSDAWDGGHRVPFIARWPGVIPASSTCDHTICLTDLFATAAAITQQQIPENAGEDSFNILPHLTGEATAPVRENTIHHSITGRFAIRSGGWKYIEGPGSGGWSLPDEAVPPDLPATQLYHVGEDPSEQVNRVADEPQIVQQLQAMLDTARNQSRTAPSHH